MATATLIPRHTPPRRRRDIVASNVRIAAAVTACALVSYAVVGQTRAAFNDTTTNSGNAFAAGTVVISDNDSASAMFNTSGMQPGTVDTSCILVTYSGSLTAAAIKMYGTTSFTGTNLAPYLDVDIDLGTGTGATAFDDCTGFSKTSDLYAGTLSNYSATYTNWASGLAVWNPSSTPESNWVRFSVTLQDDNNAQGADASATFTWEAQTQ